MATSGNMTTIPAAPTALTQTPAAGSGLTDAQWAGIGVAIAAVIVAFTCGLVRWLCGDDIIARCRKWWTKRRRRHSRSAEDSAQEIPLTRMRTASTGSQGDDSEQGKPSSSIPTVPADTNWSSAGQQQLGSTTTQETRLDDPAQLAADKCQEKLKYLYTNTGSFVQMRPLVDDDQMPIMDIYTKLHLQKDDDDYLEGEVKSYWDIFKLKTREGHSIIRAIFRGWAGLGKTTLIDKIAYDWACGSVAALKKFKLVFVLKMHSLQQRSDVIDALFDQLLDEEKINREDLKSFITTNPDDVLFLLDGFDEFKSTELDEKEFGSILKMLNRKGEYEKCSVFVTTRPSHYDTLVKNFLIRRPFALVNVLGFSEGDIEEYVHKYYSNKQSKATGLLERITFSDVLTDLAKSPMLLLLMCLLWRENATLPDTMFRLYKEALRYIFKRTKTQMSPEQISRLIISIGKVALGGLLSSDQKLSFQEEDFEPGVLDMAMRAGILTSERVCKGIDTCKSVHFIHKTFQEFCAAMYYQSLTSEGEIRQFETFFRHVSGVARFRYLLLFCCGDNDGPRTNSILEILSLKANKTEHLLDTNLQLALNCYSEIQGETMPPLEFINSVIAPTFNAVTNLSRDHSTSLMYFLNNVTDEKKGGGNACLERINSLEISPDNFGRLGAEFVQYVNKMVNLHEFHVRNNMSPLKNFQGDWARSVSYLRFNKMTQLHTVTFIGCSLPKSAMEHIVGELSSLPTSVKLDLSDNRTLGGAGQSFSRLREMSTLNKLGLRYCGLKSDDLEHIAVALSNLPELVELDRNDIMHPQTASYLEYFLSKFEQEIEAAKLVALDLTGNKTLAGSGQTWSHLGKIKNLNKLDLSNCGLKSDDLEPIAVGLSNLPNLVELDLSRNETLAGSCLSWSHLKEIKTLNKPDFSGCGLRKDDLEPIAEALSDLPKLAELSLSRNTTLADSGRSWYVLAKIKHLQKLSLSFCGLTADDKTQITEAVSQMTNLEVEY